MASLIASLPAPIISSKRFIHWLNYQFDRADFPFCFCEYPGLGRIGWIYIRLACKPERIIRWDRFPFYRPFPVYSAADISRGAASAFSHF